MKLSEEQWIALAEEIPKRQLLAFRLVYSEGLSYEKAGKMMGINRDAVAHLIKRLKAKHPDCIPNTDKPKLLRFNPSMDDGQIAEKF